MVAPRVSRDGVVAGQASLLHLDGWTVEEMALDPAAAMVVSWPEIETRSFDFATFSIKETPYNEAKDAAEEATDALRDWLDAAQQYARSRAAQDSRAAHDHKLEALAKVLDGGQPVVIIADQAYDIEAALDFAEAYGLKMILAGGQDAWKVKDRLRDAGVPVILGRTQSMPAEEDDPYDRPFRTAGELSAAGIPVAFGSGVGGSGPGGPQ